MRERLLAPFKQQAEGGYVLLLMLITSITLFIALSGILSLSMANLASAKRTMFDTGALYVAETGIDRATNELTAANGAWSGTGISGTCPMAATDVGGQVEAFNDTVKGRGTYQICAQATGDLDKEYVVYVVGRVFRTASATTPIATRRIKAIVHGKPAGSYAVQTGPGGLIMRNSSNVSQGPIYVGGYLAMSNTSSIGKPTVPIDVNVANARCGNGGQGAGIGQYPQVCASGVLPDPITLNSVQAHIYGDVAANGQTTSYPTQMTDSGLGATSGVAPPALPPYDRPAHAAAWVAAGSPTLTAAAATCPGNSGTVTWPANVKITGNVDIKQSCTVVVSGNAWITGNFLMRNSALIKVAESVATQPIIMVDGSTGVTTQQTSTVATNSSQVGMEFITFYSGQSCTLATDGTYCDTLNGPQLFTAKDILTVDIGNQGAAAGSVFYAKYTKVTLGQAGEIGALLGQTIDLAQSGNLVFTSNVVTGNFEWGVSFYDFWSP
jgi:hypothetical protein